MLDFGFSEILLTSAIALVVLGPEKLPKVARQGGNWLGRARLMARQLTEQLDREISAEEFLKQQQKTPTRAVPRTATASGVASSAGDAATAGAAATAGEAGAPSDAAAAAVVYPIPLAPTAAADASQSEMHAEPATSVNENHSTANSPIASQLTANSIKPPNESTV